VGAAIEYWRRWSGPKSALVLTALAIGCVSQGDISPRRPVPTPPSTPNPTPVEQPPPVSTPVIPDAGEPADLAPAADLAPTVVDSGPAEAAPLPPIADPTTRSDAAPPPPPSTDLARLLVLFLSVDEGTGTQVHDDSGLGQKVSVHDTDAAVWVEGRFGKAVSFSGGPRGGYLVVDSAPSLISARIEMSVAAWVLLPPAASGTIVSRRAVGSGGYLYFLRVNGGLLSAGINSGNGYHGAVTSGQALPSGRWVHVAMTFDTANLKVFIDGAMVGSSEYRLSVAPGTTPILIGATEMETAKGDAVVGVVDRLAARIDDVLIYDRALPESDLSRLASGVRPVPVPIAPPPASNQSLKKTSVPLD
jgi:hypothetical protein